MNCRKLIFIFSLFPFFRARSFERGELVTLSKTHPLTMMFFLLNDSSLQPKKTKAAQTNIRPRIRMKFRG